MNILIVVYIIGWIMCLEAVLLLIPLMTAVYYQESVGFIYLGVIVVEALIGLLIIRKKPKHTTFYAKEGCVAVALSWLVMSVFGAVPFVLTGEIPSPIDALFESVSGFTTTGASILTDIEALSHTSLMWRSLTHWIGGMGMLVFILAVIPLSGGSGVYLLKAESPGPSVSKLKPKTRTSVVILYAIYTGLTLMECLLLLCGNVGGFEAITISFGTAGTGGFAVLNTSLQSYSLYCRTVVTIFMMLFGVNFNIYFLIAVGRVRDALRSEELHCYLLIMLISAAFVFFNIVRTYDNVVSALSDACFQVASIMTTTGFATADFNEWSMQARLILVLLMFCGASAGSTGGGLKVSRLIILIKTIPKEIGYYLHPHSVRKVHFEGKTLDHETVRSVSVYLALFVVVFTVSLFLLSFDDVDLVSAFTAVAATINNIGPGLEMVGPTCNYAFFSVASKIVLIFDMLAGRLELIPVLMLFTPTVWKSVGHQAARSFTQCKVNQKENEQ